MPNTEQYFSVHWMEILSLKSLVVFHYLDCRKQCVTLCPSIYRFSISVASLKIAPLQPVFAGEAIQNLFGARYDDNNRNQCCPNDTVESGNLVEDENLEGECEDDVAAFADEGSLGSLA